MIKTYNSKTGANGQRLNLVINETLKEFYFHTCNVFNFGEVENELGIREVQRLKKDYEREGYAEVKHNTVKEVWRNQSELTEEGKELYFYAKNRFLNELERISPTCISPIIAIRQVVKKAIDQYIIDYCSRDTKAENIFSGDDFREVSNKINEEIMNNEL